MEFREDDKRRLDNVYKCLFGNGDVGMDERIRNVETYIQETKTSQQQSVAYQRGTRTTVFAGVTVVLLVEIAKYLFELMSK